MFPSSPSIDVPSFYLPGARAHLFSSGKTFPLTRWTDSLEGDRRSTSEFDCPSLTTLIVGKVSDLNKLKHPEQSSML